MSSPNELNHRLETAAAHVPVVTAFDSAPSWPWAGTARSSGCSRSNGPLVVLLEEHDEDLARLGGFLSSTASARRPRRW